MLRSIAAGFTLAVSANAASAQSVFIEAWPQATGSTCQSYALAYALDRARAPGFDNKSPSDLRASERNIRAAIARSGGDTTRWDNWSGVVCRLTNNAYSLKVTYAKDRAALFDVLDDLSPSLINGTPPGVAAFSTTQPVLVSMNAVEGSDYFKTGHVVSVLAIAPACAEAERASCVEQTRPLLILNPAIKVGAAPRPVNMCTATAYGAGEQDGRWGSGVSWVSTYTFKHLAAARIERGGCK
jgi:hypothetical protein